MSESDDVQQEIPPDPPEHAMADFECPACGHTVQAVPGPVARLVECSNCGTHFVVPSDQGSIDLPEDFGPSDEEKNENAANELNSLRMRHIVVSRRTAIRSRTYCIIGAASCLMGAVKLVMMIVTDVKIAGWHLQQYAYAVFVAASLYVAGLLARRAAYWKRESRAPLFPQGKCTQCGNDLPAATDRCPECGAAIPADQPPDFSTLSDGSQHARNLENL